MFCAKSLAVPLAPSLVHLLQTLRVRWSRPLKGISSSSFTKCCAKFLLESFAQAHAESLVKFLEKQFGAFFAKSLKKLLETPVAKHFAKPLERFSATGVECVP